MAIPVTKTENSLLYHKGLKSTASLEGIGVHSGQEVSLTLRPAEIGSGCTFIRTDLGGQTVQARWDSVVDTRNCTTVGNAEGTIVSTIEHLMAALAAHGIDQARVEVDGPEMPIMDGSACPFMDLVSRTGVEAVNHPRRIIRVLKPVAVEGQGGRRASIRPSDEPIFEVEFDFQGRAPLPKQHLVFKPLSDDFSRDIASARTFGLLEDAEKIKAMGLAKGASLENTLVYDKEKVINEGGTRFGDECARHKVLDAIGDFHLAEGLVFGHYHGVYTGHTLNNQLLRALFADSSAYEIEESPLP